METAVIGTPLPRSMKSELDIIGQTEFWMRAPLIFRYHDNDFVFTFQRFLNLRVVRQALSFVNDLFKNVLIGTSTKSNRSQLTVSLASITEMPVMTADIQKGSYLNGDLPDGPTKLKEDLVVNELKSKLNTSFMWAKFLWILIVRSLLNGNLLLPEFSMTIDRKNPALPILIISRK